MYEGFEKLRVPGKVGTRDWKLQMKAWHVTEDNKVK